MLRADGWCEDPIVNYIIHNIKNEEVNYSSTFRGLNGDIDFV